MEVVITSKQPGCGKPRLQSAPAAPTAPAPHRETPQENNQFTLLKEEARSSSKSSHNQMLEGAALPEHARRAWGCGLAKGPRGATLKLAAPLPHPPLISIHL